MRPSFPWATLRLRQALRSRCRRDCWAACCRCRSCSGTGLLLETECFPPARVLPLYLRAQRVGHKIKGIPAHTEVGTELYVVKVLRSCVPPGRRPLPGPPAAPPSGSLGACSTMRCGVRPLRGKYHANQQHRNNSSDCGRYGARHRIRKLICAARHDCAALRALLLGDLRCQSIRTGSRADVSSPGPRVRTPSCCAQALAQRRGAQESGGRATHLPRKRTAENSLAR